MDESIIDSANEGDRRTVSRESLAAFVKERDRGLAALAEMTREAQEMGLYDD